jgi:hypothetical protein
MKIIYNVPNEVFAIMLVVDIVVANIWMGFLLYGANITDKIDSWLKADTSAIETLKTKVAEYSASIAQIPTTTTLFILLAVAFGPVRPPPPPDFCVGRICLLHHPEEILDELEGLRNDCRRGVHHRPHRRRLALSHTLPHGLHRPRNLPLVVKPSKDLLQPG